MTIVITMCKLLIAMLIGFYLFKKGILNPEANAKISAMIVQVTAPCLMISSVSSVERGGSGAVMKLFVAGIAAYALYVVLAFFITLLLRVPAYLRGTYMCMFIFSNSMFMGFPVVQTLFGDSAIFYIMIFNLPFNILFYSLGLYFLRKDAAMESRVYKKEKTDPKKFLNSGIISSTAALIIYFADIPVPEIIYACAGFVGDITTPLSMIIIGSSIAAASFKEIRTEKGILPMLPIRLGLIPALVWLFMHLFTQDKTIINICTIGAGMPVASLVAMGSAPYPRQNKCASIGVVVSTVASLITIPVMAVLLGVNGR